MSRVWIAQVRVRVELRLWALYLARAHEFGVQLDEERRRELWWQVSTYRLQEVVQEHGG